MNSKRIIITTIAILLLIGILIFIIKPREDCRTDLILSDEPEWTETCYKYNPLSRALNQLRNSGDLRCGSKNWCGWYNEQAHMGIVVEECRELTKEDFCYYTERNISPTQIEIIPKALKTITFSCNSNLNPNWCDYEIRECSAWRIGLFNQQFCPQNMNLRDCGEHFNVTICEFKEVLE